MRSLALTKCLKWNILYEKGDEIDYLVFLKGGLGYLIDWSNFGCIHAFVSSRYSTISFIYTDEESSWKTDVYRTLDFAIPRHI